jgi:hypothetical protein
MTTNDSTRLLLVIGDSISFYGQDEILGLEHPATLGFQIADRMTACTGTRWRAVNASHGGRTAFDARKLLRKDALFRAVVAEADVLFLQAGGKDGIVTPFPRFARLVIGRIPQRHRGRFVRWIKPKLAKVTSRQFPLTPPRLFTKSWHGLVDDIRSINPDVVLVTASPAREYGHQTIVKFPENWLHPDGHVQTIRRMARAEGLPQVDLIALIDEWFTEADLVPDFLHWPPAMHAFAADRIAPVILDALAAADGTALAIEGERVPWPTAV